MSGRSGTRLTSRPAGALLLAAIAIAALTPSGSIEAQTTPAEPTAVTPATGPDADHHLRIVDQTTWVDPDGDFTLRLAADAPQGATVEVTVHDRPIGRDQFREDLIDGPSGEVIGRSCASLVDGGFRVLEPCSVPLDRADLDEDSAVTVGVGLRSSSEGPPDRLLIPAGADGAYPVLVRLLDGDGIEIDRLVTHLLRTPPDSDVSPPLDLSLVVPLAAPLALRPDGTTVVDDDDRIALAATIDALASQPDVPLVLAPRPETLDSLATDPEGVDVLTRLADALEGRQVLDLPYVEADPGSWWDAGLDREYTDLLDTGAAAVTLHLGVPPDRGTVLVGPTTDGPTLTRLRDQGAQNLVVPQALLVPIDESLFGRDLDRPFTATVADGPTLPAVMDDAGLRAHLGQTGDPRLDARYVLADLTVLYSQYPGIPRGVALGLTTDTATATSGAPTADTAYAAGTPDFALFLATLLDGIAESPVLRGATVPDLLDRAETARVGGSDAREGETLTRTYLSVTPPDLGDYPAARRQAETDLAPYRDIAVADLPVVDELLRVSGAGELSDDEQQEYLDSAVAQVTGLASGIVLPPASRVTLTAREGLIPVELRNDLDRDVQVLVRLASDKLEFPEGDERLVTLPPGTTNLEWLVRARATGAFPVEVSVLSPDGSVDLDSTRFTMRSTAVPGVGIALSAIAAVFLAIWWARHWHTARRARDLV